MFIPLIILKPALEPPNSGSQSQLRKYFTKYFFLVLLYVYAAYKRDSYDHYQDCFITVSVLKCKKYLYLQRHFVRSFP